MSNKAYAFDSRLEHRALGSAAITSTATLDTITERAAQRTDYRTIATVEAIKISANDELYQIVVECSNDGFTTLEVADVKDFGATEVRQSGAPDSLVADIVELYWCTEINGTKYAASRVRLIASGTSPSITLGCYSTVV